ncbi:hypothetical protein NDU88_004100 [Pleurodeles waltl]|uniref:Uncharacterized protein n=1 Tax=Pleurodeles waltl TaxID=8319 RepID=A0AAV7T8M5_PLEWA|nr:hypothetical protein NDU88_004100 [Pleurodeles waltl]
MLTKLGGQGTGEGLSYSSQEPSMGSKDMVSPDTRSILKVLLVSLKEDLQTVKKVVHQDLAEIGDRVSSLEDYLSRRDEAIEQLQQENIHLKDQHIDLQAQEEDLKNISRCNNICIRDASSIADRKDIGAYTRALFAQILNIPETDIQLLKERLAAGSRNYCARTAGSSRTAIQWHGQNRRNLNQA